MEDDTLDWYRSTGTRWPTAPLRSSCELVNGFPFPSASFKDSGVIPLVRVRDIRGSTFKTYLDHHPDPRFVIENGNLVIGMDGDFNCIRWVRGAAALNQRICLLKSADTTRLRFIAYALPRALKHLNDFMPAATVKHLSSSEILKTHIPVPGVEEIGLIVRYLDHAELRIAKAIAAKQDVVRLLREARLAMISETVLAGSGTEVERMDSGIPGVGSVPAHWRIRRAKYVWKAVDVRSVTGTEERLTVSSASGIVPRSSKNVTMFEAATYVGHKVAQPNDLVINSLWAWAGGLGVSNHHGLVSPVYGVYRLQDDAQCDPVFMHNLLRSNACQWQFQVRSKGIWRSRLSITDEAFFDMPLPLPSLDEQRTIADTIRTQTANVDRAIASVLDEIALLKEYRIRLISDVVTGKLDVCDEAAKLPEIDQLELATVSIGENDDDEEATDDD